MTRNHCSSWRLVFPAAALSAAVPECNAALFGFGAINDMVWGNIAAAIVQVISPAEIMLVSILMDARRRRALH